MRITPRLPILALALVNTLVSAGTCWNPLGCEPKNYEQCLLAASEAKTETAAKALISQCDRFKVTQAMCVADAKRFADEQAHPNSKLAQARKVHPELAELEDVDVVAVMHEVYYPDIPIDELQRRVGITPHPERANCQRFHAELYRAADAAPGHAVGAKVGLPTAASATAGR